MEDITYATKLHEAETRKVQLTGGATLIVSLPKEWTRQVNLRPGDEVIVLPQLDKSLLIVPKKALRFPHFEANINLREVNELNQSKIERLLIAYYLAGVDILRIEFDGDMPEIRRLIKKIIREKLTGIEIIEESRDQLVLQNLVSTIDTDIHSLIVKMLKSIINMLNDLKVGLEKRDTLILNDIIDRDEEVDRFYWFIRRLLKKTLASGLLMISISIRDPRSILEYSTIGKMLERIADNIAEIANEIVQKIGDNIAKIPGEIVKGISKVIEMQLNQLETLMDILSTRKLTFTNINQVIDEARLRTGTEIENILAQLYGEELPRNIATSLRLVLYNLLRITEYTIDVAEALLDMIIDNMVKIT